MSQPTQDLRITGVRPLIPPAILIEELPIIEQTSTLVAGTRETISAIMERRDPRLVVVVGPCSIHDPAAAVEYASRLRPLADRYARRLTYVIGPDGKIEQAIDTKDPAGQAAELLKTH